MKNLRKHFLINPAFQVRFSLLFTAAVIVFSSIFPIFVFTLLETMEHHAYFKKNNGLATALNEARSDVIIFLLVMLLIITVLAFFLALFHSHRIAGPLYKLRISMIAMQQGVLDHHIRFRNKDNFMELADGFNLMTDAIFSRRRKDFERVHSVIPKLELLERSLQGEEQATVSEVLLALKELSRDTKKQTAN